MNTLDTPIEFAALGCLTTTCTSGTFSGLSETFLLNEIAHDEEMSVVHDIDAPEFMAAGACASQEDFLGCWRGQLIVPRCVDA